MWRAKGAESIGRNAISEPIDDDLAFYYLKVIITLVSLSSKNRITSKVDNQTPEELELKKGGTILPFLSSLHSRPIQQAHPQ